MTGRILRVTACIVLGVFFTVTLYIGIARSISAGYFVRWHKLPTAPAPIEEFVIGAHGTVYARTASDLVYRCSSWRDECWVQDEIPQDTSYFLNTTAPCDFSAPEFSWTTNPPANPVICIQGEEVHADCFGEDTYFLDENGDVWEWSNTVCANIGGALFMLCTSVIIGAGVGLVAGIVWSYWLSRRKKGETIPTADRVD